VATKNSKGSLIITGSNCPVLLEFSKAALNKCAAIDLPLLRAIQEPALGSLGFFCHQSLGLIQKGWWQHISTLRIMDLTKTQISTFGLA